MDAEQLEAYIQDQVRTCVRGLEDGRAASLSGRADARPRPPVPEHAELLFDDVSHDGDHDNDRNNADAASTLDPHVYDLQVRMQQLQQQLQQLQLQQRPPQQQQQLQQNNGRSLSGLGDNSGFRFRSYDEQTDATPSVFGDDNDYTLTNMPRAVGKNYSRLCKHARKEIKYNNAWASPSVRIDKVSNLELLQHLREDEKALYALALAKQNPQNAPAIIGVVHDWMFFNLHMQTLKLVATSAAQYPEAAATVSRAFRGSNPLPFIPDEVALLIKTADDNAREERLIKTLQGLNTSNRNSGNSSNGGRQRSNSSNSGFRGRRGYSSRGGSNSGSSSSRQSQYNHGRDSNRQPSRGRGGYSSVTSKTDAGDQGQ